MVLKMKFVKSVMNLMAACLLLVVVSPVCAEEVADVPESYKIGPGDVLGISVWKEEGMQLEVLVKPDGGITFPLVGDLMASGLTTRELSDRIVAELKKYIPSPVVTVSVLRVA